MDTLALMGAFFVCWGWTPADNATSYYTFINGVPYSASPDVGTCACVEIDDHLEVFAQGFGHNSPTMSDRFVGVDEWESYLMRVRVHPDTQLYCD